MPQFEVDMNVDNIPLLSFFVLFLWILYSPICIEPSTQLGIFLQESLLHMNTIKTSTTSTLGIVYLANIIISGILWYVLFVLSVFKSITIMKLIGLFHIPVVINIVIFVIAVVVIWIASFRYFGSQLMYGFIVIDILTIHGCINFITQKGLNNVNR